MDSGMAGVATEEFGIGRSLEEVGNGQQLCQSGEALAEWRSSEHIENGTPSTSPPYWDSDDDDGGPKPSELYGKHTWKIDKFSQVDKRELRSNAFDVGGYKWYILIYPQGCDVCNHLSLFLCVANHDKLLPGWSHFAQFTIAVVNKDPKKSKYSDTLHRFWKKEHDWGWKKFMELSKVMDGFIDADTLVIKAQVQVIRERADRPFHCLDYQYRRELVRVYLTNVETICRRFVEECRGKLVNLIEDKARWSSFRAFWLGMDQRSRCCISQEKTDAILKIIVKHFFIEKEVTSTLVMDSLYSGLKALKGQTKGKKIKGKDLEIEDSPVPFIRIEKEMLALVDDVLPLIERASMEPLPSKDEKGPQNRTKDVAAGEFNKDFIERDERRLTELGRRTIEIFVLAHIISKIEVAYQEAVSLKRQEELIREEEAAWLADVEQKMKCGALDKEKKSKKKQGKQKRNTRKGKDKGRDDKPESNALEKAEEDDPTVDKKDILNAESEMILETLALEDVSDASDPADRVPELLPPDSADRDETPVNWDAHISGMHPPSEGSSSENSGLSRVQNGIEGSSLSMVDDNSSTCSTESVPSFVTSVPHNGNSRNNKIQKKSIGARNHRRKITPNTTHWVNEELSQPFERVPDGVQLDDASQSSKTFKSNSTAPVRLLQDHVNLTGRQVGKEEVHSNLGDKNTCRVELDDDRTAYVVSPPRSPASISTISIATSKLESKMQVKTDPILAKKPPSESEKQVDRTSNVSNSAENAATSQSDNQKFATPKHAENPSGNQVSVVSEKAPMQHARVATDKPSTPHVPVVSRPLSAPIYRAPRPAVAVVSVQTTSTLARSVSATGRLGPEATASASPSQSYVPQSYRNATIGSQVTGNSSAYTQNHSASSVTNAPLFLPHSSDIMYSNSIRPRFPFGTVNHQDILQNRPPWSETRQMDNKNLTVDHAPLLNEMPRYDLYSPVCRRSEDRPSELPASTSGRQNHESVDEFPHIDIINELLDDDHGLGMSYQSLKNGPHNILRQFSLPSYHHDMSSRQVLSPGLCRFERTRSYLNDGFQRGYGSFTANQYDPIQDIWLHTGPRPYVNGHIDGLTHNQWQISGDMPCSSINNGEIDGYPYHILDFPNHAVGINGYSVFRPSNGL